MASRASAAHLVPWPRAHCFCCSWRTQVHLAPSCTPAPPGLLHGPVGRAITPLYLTSPLPKELWQVGLARCWQMPPAKRGAKLLSAAGNWPAGLNPISNSTSPAPAWTPGCVCWVSTAPFMSLSRGQGTSQYDFLCHRLQDASFGFYPYPTAFFYMMLLIT